MNNTIKELKDRKSVRVYEDIEISDEDRNTILEAAVNAPSAGNQEMYRIINVTDQEIKEKLAVLCDNQPFIAKAKMVLLFCSDFQKWYDIFKYNGQEPRKVGTGDLMLSIEDASIAAQNAVTAAWALGIGSCYIGDIMENKETITELLDLPPYVFPSILLVFGYPTKQQKERIKPKRESLKYLVCENKYVPYSKDDLYAMLEDKQELTNEKTVEWISRFYNRKYNSDFANEMTRSVNEYLKNYK